MGRFYKVVRPDLASFADPTFRYRVGFTSVAPDSGGERRLCRPGLLHASPSPEQAARYWIWPYRLLEVDGDPVVSQPDKSGFIRLRVVRELPVEQCFGPNGAAVLEVIRQAEGLTDAQIATIATAWIGWDDIKDSDWNAAWAATIHATPGAAKDAAWANGRAAIEALWPGGVRARDRAAAGSAARNAVGTVAARNAEIAAKIPWAAAGAAAVAAARVAAVADLVGQPGLTQTHLDTLMAPWLTVFPRKD